MPLVTVNLGMVKAIFVGTTPPSNTRALWYDTNVNLHKYYSTISSSWNLLIPSPVTSKSGIIAYVGGGQTNATPLTTTLNRVDVSLADNASVLLLPATKDSEQLIQNNTGAVVDCYPQPGQNFLGLSVNTPISIQPGNQLRVHCYDAGEYTQI